MVGEGVARKIADGGLRRAYHGTNPGCGASVEPVSRPQREAAAGCITAEDEDEASRADGPVLRANGVRPLIEVPHGCPKMHADRPGGAPGARVTRLTQEIHRRLGPRRTLSAAELSAQMGAREPADGAEEALTRLAGWIGIPVGQLRPEDDLERLLATPGRTRPIGRLRFRRGLEAIISDIYFGLATRLGEWGIQIQADLRIRTVEEYVHAWCGAPLERPSPE